MDLVARLDPRHVQGADVVVAFPGPGLVGGIVVEELVETLGLRHVGSIGGALLPPQALVENGRPNWPVLCFATQGVLAVKVEVELADGEAHAFSRALVEHLHGAGARSLLIADGIPGAPVQFEDLVIAGPPSMADALPVLATSWDADLGERLYAAGIEEMEDAVFGGGAAATLLWAEVAGLPAALVGVTARPNLPDVRAAASLVAALARVLGLGVDVADLREHGEELERAWIRILEDAQAPTGVRDSMFS